MHDNDNSNGSSDDVGTGSPSPDAHGQAALLLVESLIHGLCEKADLSTGEAVEIAERAVSVQQDYAEAADGTGASMWRSHALLKSIAASLKIDGHAGPMAHHHSGEAV